MFVCVCVHVCECVRERDREKESNRERGREREIVTHLRIAPKFGQYCLHIRSGMTVSHKYIRHGI